MVRERKVCLFYFARRVAGGDAPKLLLVCSEFVRTERGGGGAGGEGGGGSKMHVARGERRRGEGQKKKRRKCEEGRCLRWPLNTRFAFSLLFFSPSCVLSCLVLSCPAPSPSFSSPLSPLLSPPPPPPWMLTSFFCVDSASSTSRPHLASTFFFGFQFGLRALVCLFVFFFHSFFCIFHGVQREAGFAARSRRRDTILGSRGLLFVVAPFILLVFQFIFFIFLRCLFVCGVCFFG